MHQLHTLLGTETGACCNAVYIDPSDCPEKGIRTRIYLIYILQYLRYCAYVDLSLVIADQSISRTNPHLIDSRLCPNR